MTLIKNIVVLSAIGTAVSTDSFQPASLGFGVQRLKNFKSRGGPLKATTTCPEVAQYWYKDAVIDNFAPIQNQKKWEGEGQRYWLNREFWGGVDFPIFVYIGGEGAESCSRLTNRMYAYQLAQQHQALLVDVEHRFYGESYPTADMSTKNLQHLSADQALADLARIIGHIKSDLNTASSKVVTIGGSYPGNLAAWFRLKYPSVTQGSIASSAPVLAQTNFYAYMDVVGQSIIHFSGQACFDAFESAAKTLASYADAGNYAQLEKDFNTCNPIGSTNDLKVLLSDLMGNVQGTIQYNNEHSGVMNVTDICGTMQQSTDYYANFIALQALYRQANGQSCEDASYADTIAYLSNPEKDANNNGRPWTYQTCNEFGYFQTADSKVCSVSTFNRMLSLWNLCCLTLRMCCIDNMIT
jgi:serine protease 16